MSIAVMLVLVGFIEAFLHYVSKREVLGRDLPKPVAYVLGTLGMMGPFTWWLIEHGYGDVASTLWLVLCTGGTSVGMWYFVDWVHLMTVSLRESRAREKAALTGLKEGLDVTKPRQQ